MTTAPAPIERRGRDRDGVAQRGVDADERVCPDPHMARHDDVRGDEAVVLDGRVVADVIAAPQRDVVADVHERLDRCCLRG